MKKQFLREEILNILNMNSIQILILSSIRFKLLYIFVLYAGWSVKMLNTHDMSIDKLLQISFSNYGLLLYFSRIRIWHL